MIYKIPVTWHVYGTYSVEADSIDKVIEMVLGAEPPYDRLPRGEYVDDSMEVNMDCLKEMNPNDFQKESS